MRRRVLLSLLAILLVSVGLIATGLGPKLVAVAYLGALTPWLVWFDVTTHRLPNRIVVPGIGVGLLGCGGEWMVSGHIPLVPLLAAAVYAGFLLFLNLVGGMGMGDVKLAAALGLASWTLSVALLSPVIAFLVGGLVSIALLIAGRRGSRIAFGPFLLGGFWAAVALAALSRL